MKKTGAEGFCQKHDKTPVVMDQVTTIWLNVQIDKNKAEPNPSLVGRILPFSITLTVLSGVKQIFP